MIEPFSSNLDTCEHETQRNRSLFQGLFTLALATMALETDDVGDSHAEKGCKEDGCDQEDDDQAHE